MLKIFLAKAWPALDIHIPSCDPQLQDLVLAELDDFQPTAIQEPGEPQTLRAFFTSRDSRDGAARALGAAFGHHVFVAPIDIEDEDWAARSQANLHAITVGRITVAPPWDTKRGRVPFSEETLEKGTRPLVAVFAREREGFPRSLAL